MADPTKDERKKQEEEEKAAAEKAAAKTQASGERKPSEAEIAKAVAGLRFRTNKAMPVIDDTTGKQMMERGKPKMRYFPDVRPMTVADVLDAKSVDGALVIVSADGGKHIVKK